ncbi:hypothetical protein BVRB_9g218880 [Beta vulgaris subsp. vulgaris]|nr:hypothetical protein BVRB_9g218880 [Beta vulgaris subsp. vulgaris]
MEEHSNVISIFENRNVKQHTTRSWDFLESYQHQFHHSCESIWKKASSGEDIIIANVDTGVWPESKSFSDEGFGPIPKKFKGRCENENDPTFKCNRKLIGARYFFKGIAEVLASSNTTVNIKPSPRDMMGHGSHTLSTAGGNVVPVLRNDAFCFEALDINNVSVKGGSPRSRVVSYKAVWPELKIPSAAACYMDSLAAMEAAIADGVDVINLSLGAQYTIDDLKAPGDYYFQDPYSITSFHAMVNGIVIVTSVGNDGPKPPVVGNPAPWVLTVAAGTMDREFTCNIILGNHQKIKAARYFDPPSNDTFYPLISGADARIIGVDLTNASYCFPGTLDPVKVNGKILVCTVEHGDLSMPYLTIEATKIGAIGVIATNNEILGSTLSPDSNQMLPTAHITYKDAQTLFSYINSTRQV